MWESKGNAGHSLVEILMTMAILSILFIAYRSVSTDKDKLRAHNASKATAQKESEQIFATIKRDYAMQIPGNTQIIADGTGLEIVRISPKQNNPYVNYRVQFRSICKSFSSQQTAQSKVYDQAFRDDLYAAKNKCLAKLNCPSGFYPSLEIVTQGQAESYSPSSYPVPAKSILEKPIGIALCAEQLADQVKVWLEVVVAQKPSKTYEASIVSKPLLLPLKSARDLVFIPN